jgi:predicted ATPase
MLEKLELHNFKGHRDTQLNFDSSRLHALVGQNGSGKTSVLQALHYLSRLADESPNIIFSHGTAPEFITTTTQTGVSVTGSGYLSSTDKRKWEASYTILLNEEGWDALISYQFDRDEERRILHGFSASTETLQKFELPISRSLRSAVHLKLVATNLAKASYSEAVAPKLEFDGSGLASTLDYLRSEDPDDFDALQKMLQQVVPSVRKVGVKRAQVEIDRQRLIRVDGKSIAYGDSQTVIGQEVVLDMKTGERIPASEISEGTMLTLGLLTALMTPPQPSLLLLDDIEQGLHPKAQRELIDVFKEIIQANEDLQIIFSTHSPYIVDALEPSQVHVLSNTPAGFTHVKRLDEHPDIEWATQTLTTGEFWDAEGEDWVVAGENNA